MENKYEILLGKKGDLTINITERYPDGKETTIKAISSIENNIKKMKNEIVSKKSEIKDMKKYVKALESRIPDAEGKLEKFKRIQKRFPSASSESPKEEKPKQ